MTRSSLLLALWSAATLAQAGEFTLSPASHAVTKGNQTAEILVSYQPSAGIGDAWVTLKLNLDHLGWMQAQKIPASTSDYVTSCSVSNGLLWAGLITRVPGPLPTQAPIPLCRFRVRAFAQATAGRHTITTDPRARTTSLVPAPATANNVDVIVR